MLFVNFISVKPGEEKETNFLCHFSSKRYNIPIPFLHCLSDFYAVVIQVKCGYLNNNVHSIYQFILKC